MNSLNTQESEFPNADASQGKARMTRVLVVGSDTREELELLGRIRHAAGLPAGALSSSKDLDECDLVVVKDTPALRNAAMRILSLRPALQLWVADQHGTLRDGRMENAPPLDGHAIGQRLASLPATVSLVDAVLLASGRKQVTRLLRERQRSRMGRLLLSVQHHPYMLMDFHNDQAIVLGRQREGVAAIAAYLGEAFNTLALQELSAEQYQLLAEEKPRQPMRPLLWQMAAHGTWEELDARLQRDERVRVLRWPDFRVLGNQHDGFRLSSLLLKKACTVQECVSLLEMDEVEVRAFIYAAYLCGYAQLEPPAATSASAPVVSPVARGGSLLARMWRSVRARAGDK